MPLGVMTTAFVPRSSLRLEQTIAKASGGPSLVFCGVCVDMDCRQNCCKLAALTALRYMLLDCTWQL